LGPSLSSFAGEGLGGDFPLLEQVLLQGFDSSRIFNQLLPIIGTCLSSSRRRFIVRHPYYEAVFLVERVHRHFLEVVKADLDRHGVQDINNVQALILYNIGKDEMTVGELTARGYYLGSNVSYNVKKMSENGYITQERSPHDKRSVRVKLSDKGMVLHKRMEENLEKQVAALQGANISGEELTKVGDSLKKLERFWSGMVNYNT
jgi:DNA-binding MarR family transcriptional regulator